jgi:hypothetical protein
MGHTPCHVGDLFQMWPFKTHGTAKCSRVHMYVLAHTSTDGFQRHKPKLFGGWQGSGDFWAQLAKIHPFTNFYRFFHDLTGCKLVVINLDQPISYICFSSVGWFLLYYNDNWPRTWELKSKSVFQYSKSMKCNNEAKVLNVHHSPNHYKLTMDRLPKP